MSDFDKSLAFAMKWEGGDKITDHPSDPGGLTKYGISQRAYPAADIRALTYSQAAEIYRRDYWDRMRCNDLTWPVNLVLFDSAVNCGAGRTIRWLQAMSGTLVDGIMGQRTVRAANRETARNLSVVLIQLRENHYRTLPTFETFGKGWINRLSDLRKVAGL